MEIVPSEQCTGCGACWNACPVNCIDLTQRDILGFIHPQINECACISCNKCRDVCPVLNTCAKNSITQDVYAAWSLDDKVRMFSSSGGIFPELAKNILGCGGVVVGARYNEEHMVEHFLIEDTHDLPSLMQSKYVQSNIKLVYREIKTRLRQQRVMFVGSPCQCAGLLNFLGEHPDNLLVVDFVCHGAASPIAYQQFLHDLEQRFGSPITSIRFRDKQQGWKSLGIRVDFESQECYTKNGRAEMYLRNFLHGTSLRECCIHCAWASTKRVSDITLGDFWGIRDTVDDDKGISLIIINSPLGNIELMNIRDNIFLTHKTMAEATRHNKSLRRPARRRS